MEKCISKANARQILLFFINASKDRYIQLKALQLSSFHTRFEYGLQITNAFI